ncbi:MAG TPA: DMT family transporter [Syntrophaceticus sp.]|nr:DMT family transporter [Syntrophaceticus sp.]
METVEKPQFNPYLAVLLAVMCVSLSSIFVRLSTAHPMMIAFYRMALSALFLAPFALNRNGRKELQGMNSSDIIAAITAGLFLAAHFTVWNTSLEYTSVASSTVLVTMQPLFVVTLGYIFLKEKISTKSMAGAALALTGSILVGAADFQIGGKALLGDILAFSGAFFIAVYFLIGRQLRMKLSLFPYVFFVYGTAAGFLLIANLLVRIPFYPYPPLDWLWFIALTIIPTIGGHTVYNWALRYVKTIVVSVSILGEPVGATILAFLIFREMPGSLQLLGDLIIITGLYIFLISARTEEKNN